MQKKVRRPMSPLSESSVTTAVISSDSKRTETPAISNDNSKQDGPNSEFSARPKVFMSPKKAAAQNQAVKKKSVRFSTEFSAHSDTPVAVAARKITAKTALSASSEHPSGDRKMPLLSTPKDAPESEDILAEDLAPIRREPVKSGGLFFDIKFAFGLIAIVVAVNLLLAMLVDKAEEKKAPAIAATPVKATPVATAPAQPAPVKIVATPAPVASPAPAALKPLPVAAQPAPQADVPQGAIVSNNSLPDIQPAAGTALPVAPAAQAKPQPSLGVVTSAADEKAAAAPRRNLLSIIDQSN